MLVMPAPGQQAVVTVNYTQLAVLGAEFVGRTIANLNKAGVEVFDVSAEAEERWTQKIVDSFVDSSRGHVRLHTVADQHGGPPARR